MLSDKRLKNLAEYIILSHTEDIEFMSTWEIMDDQLQHEAQYSKLTDDQQHELAKKIDKLIRTAVVTVEFPKE